MAFDIFLLLCSCPTVVLDDIYTYINIPTQFSSDIRKGSDFNG